MSTPAWRKKNSRRLIFLVLFILFCFSGNLAALPFITSNSDRPAFERYAHSHQQPPLPSLIDTDGAEDKAEQQESVRLRVTGARLACSEDDCSHHHHGCDLEIAYRLSVEIQQDLDVGAKVVCHARLDYTTSHGYHLKSERCSSPVSHTLHHRTHIDSTMVVEFQFSPYEQVIDAQVDSIHCRIEKAGLMLGSALQ